MPATLEEVQKVIREAFPGADVKGIEEKNHRIFGSIIWKGFKKMKFEERNRQVTEKVRDKLGFEGIRVGILFPLAPKERLT